MDVVHRSRQEFIAQHPARRRSPHYENEQHQRACRAPERGCEAAVRPDKGQKRKAGEKGRSRECQPQRRNGGRFFLRDFSWGRAHSVLAWCGIISRTVCFQALKTSVILVDASVTRRIAADRRSLESRTAGAEMPIAATILPSLSRTGAATQEPRQCVPLHPANSLWF